MYNLCINQSKSTQVGFTAKKTDNDADALSKSIKRSLKVLHDRAEREVAEYDYFKPVQVAFENTDKSLYVGTIKLKISQPPRESGPDYKTKRYIEATVYSPTKGQNVSSLISQGTKKEILEKLNDKHFIKDIQEFIKDSSVMLIDESY